MSTDANCQCASHFDPHFLFISFVCDLGYKPSLLNIPGSELLADNAYAATGFLSLSSSHEATCSSSYKSHGVAVDSCITENSISYKFQLVKGTRVVHWFTFWLFIFSFSCVFKFR